MEDSENHRKKLKEDLAIMEEKIGNLGQKLFDADKQQGEALHILEAQVRQFSSDRTFMRNE